MTGTGADSDPKPPQQPEVPLWDTHPVQNDPRRGRAGLIIAALAPVLALCVGAGVFGVLTVRNVTSAESAGEAAPPPAPQRRLVAPSATGEPVPEGPQASSYAPVDDRDLEKVCDGEVYFPQSPKRAGKAPHPVVLLRADRPDSNRIQDQNYYYDLGYSDSVERTWAAEKVAKVQLVACIDLVRGGSTIRRCEYDDPAPDTLSLVRATWRLHVYELATGRKLLDKRLTGDDQSCPSIVLYGPDKKIYAKVGDRAVIAALRPFVTK
jgi:hypothetical protein